jgi:CRP-like cAMP-binding protein
MEWRLLAGVPPEHVRELLSIARRPTFARNEVVFHRDDPGDSLHLISKGRFSIRVMTPLGDVATVAIRGPGESFGEMVLIAEEPRRAATVTALEEAETFAVYRVEFDRLRTVQPHRCDSPSRDADHKYRRRSRASSKRPTAISRQTYTRMCLLSGEGGKTGPLTTRQLAGPPRPAWRAIRE